MNTKARIYNFLAPVIPWHVANMRGRRFDLAAKKAVNLDGLSLYVMPNDYIGRAIIRDGTYEPHVTALIRRELKPGDRFLDVGANLGYYTLLASSIVGSAGHVYGVEPNPQNLQLLFESLTANGLQNVTIYPVAATDKARVLRFVTVGSNGGVVTDNSLDQTHHLLVQGIRLDDIHRSPVDMIKIDVEAHEPFALAGMPKLLASRPKLITEFHPWAMRQNGLGDPADYLHQLESLGYGLSVILPDGSTKVFDPVGILAYWAALEQETAHLDLYCAP